MGSTNDVETIDSHVDKNDSLNFKTCSRQIKDSSLKKTKTPMNLLEEYIEDYLLEFWGRECFLKLSKAINGRLADLTT